MSAEPLTAEEFFLGGRRPRWAWSLLPVSFAIAIACGSGDSPTEAEGSTASPPEASSARPAASVPLATSQASGASTPAEELVATDGTGPLPSELTDSPSSTAPPPSAPGGSCDLDSALGSFEQSCVACAGSDACASCLCSSCTDEVQRCVSTAGCMEILACGRANNCSGMACYCGTANALSCLNGNANGACRGVIEGAMGGRAPSAREPSAGPAAERAGAVAECLQRDDTCRSACSAP